MPTYGYRCKGCSTEFEVWQKMTDAAVASCPACGAQATRLFFPAGIVFKGSGFYKTDSRSSSASTSTSSASKPSTGAKPASDGAGADSPSTASPPSPAPAADSPS